jgi:predicted transcriptional regulator
MELVRDIRGYPVASRKTDPETSHMAEAEVTDSGGRDKQCQQVLEAIRLDPGSTAVELGHRFGIDRYAVSRRTSDLESRGLVEKGERRACRINGSQMVTWFAIEVDPEQMELI